MVALILKIYRAIITIEKGSVCLPEAPGINQTVPQCVGSEPRNVLQRQEPTQAG